MALPPLTEVGALLLDLDDTILDDRSGILGAWGAVVELVHEAHPDLAPDAIEAGIAECTDWFWSDPERERRGRLDLLRAARVLRLPFHNELSLDDVDAICDAIAEYFGGAGGSR